MRVGLLGLGRIGAFHAATLAAHPLVDELIVHGSRTRLPVLAGRETPSRRTRWSSPPRPAPTPSSSSKAARLRHPGLLRGAGRRQRQGDLEVLGRPARGNRVQIGFQRRFDPGYIAAARPCAPVSWASCTGSTCITADPSPPPAAYIPLSGGIFRDCHIHDFDILRWVTGREVVSVYATGANRGAAFFGAAGDVDTSAALLTLDDGTLATVQGSALQRRGVRRAHGTGGHQGHQGRRPRPARAAVQTEGLQPPGEPWPDFVARFADAYAAELDASCARPGLCSIEDALAALYVAEAAELSRREHRPVAGRGGDQR